QGECMYMSNNNGHLYFNPVNIWSGNWDYVDGAMQAWDSRNWSDTTTFRLQIRRGTDTGIPAPKILLGFRSRYSTTDVYGCIYTSLVSSASFTYLDIAPSSFALSNGFTWADIQAMTIQIKSSVNSNVPDDVVINKISRFYDRPQNDQRWTNLVFKAGAVSNDWSIQDSALHIKGIPNSSGDLCESSFSPGDRDWSGCRNLSLRMKRGSGTPRLYIKVYDQSGNTGARELAVTNSNYQPFVFPIRSLAPYDEFNWAAVTQVTFQVQGVSGTTTELFVDEMSLGVYSGSQKFETASEIFYNKENWFYQLYSADGFESDVRPDAVELKAAFPNLHMINYFDIIKVEGGVEKDFRISSGRDAGLMELYNQLTADDYFLAGVSLPVPPLVLSTGDLQITRGGSKSLYVCLESAPSVPVTVRVEKTSGDSTISQVHGGSEHVFSSTNWNVNWQMIFAAADSMTHTNGSAVYTFWAGDTELGSVYIHAAGGCTWHIPATAEPAGHTMLEPYVGAASDEPVYIYSKTYANTYDQNGGTLYHRKNGDVSWNSSKLTYDCSSVAEGITSAYWKASISGGTYSAADSIEYYLKSTYVGCEDTYIGSAEEGASCMFSLAEADAQANLFTLTYVNEYVLTSSAGDHGVISPSGEVTISAGRDQAFTVTASNLYRIADILTNGASIGVDFDNADSSYVFTWENISDHGAVAASFVEKVTTNTPLNVPLVWLEQYYPGTEDYEATAAADSDGDQLTAWQEYVAGTDPTEAASVLLGEVQSSSTDEADPVICWMGSDQPGRAYSILWNNALSGTEWSVLVEDVLSAYPAINSYTDAQHTAEQVNYYRIQVKPVE
ncbi:MAG: hypothetical protein PHG65_13680, partial [Kiritimatiellae bacterium]|nr:hypothetical protein [Kiritimatiellia bacterium]